MSAFENQMSNYTDMINSALDIKVPESEISIEKSMRYSVMAGGKRIRPILTLAVCDLFGTDCRHALSFACAIELIHTYSLIYDDLPCMDNDILRRGKPTNHITFGEDIALMAGMGLYARAFETVLSSYKNDNLSSEQCIAGMKVLADASGLNGIVLGQVLDSQNTNGKDMTLDDLYQIHQLKTSAMLEAAAVLGAIVADISDKDLEKIKQYAKLIGLAFQIKDDILDVTGTIEDMGKSIGKDGLSQKVTFVDLLGLKASQEKVVKLTKQAKQCLSKFQNNSFLCTLADYLCNRTH